MEQPQKEYAIARMLEEEGIQNALPTEEAYLDDNVS